MFYILLAFLVEILAFLVEILAFSVEILAFLVEILAFSVEILAFSVEILAFSVEILAFIVITILGEWVWCYCRRRLRRTDFRRFRLVFFFGFLRDILRPPLFSSCNIKYGISFSDN